MDRQGLEQFAAMLEALRTAEQQSPVTPYQSPQSLLEQFDLGLTPQGRSESVVLQELTEIAKVTPRTASTGFFNQLYGGRIDVAMYADMLVTFLNSSMYTYKVSGIHTLIEKEVVKNVCRYIGFDQGEGIFTPGGSISNLNAMIIARNVVGQSRDAGLDGKKYRIYVSENGHYSVRKGAGLIGVGRDQVVFVPTDEKGAMIPAALDQLMAADVAAGLVPMMVIATVATTVTGSFDPVSEIEPIVRRYKAWFHVDGAWGGPLLMEPNTRPLMAGVENADSFTWDAHKMMGVPLVASLLLVRNPGTLKDHFNEQADYLFQVDEDEFNLGTQSIQCARRNDALKLWAAWRYFGDEGYAQRLTYLRHLTDYVAQSVRCHPRMTLALDPKALNICFEVNGSDSQKICEELMYRGLAKVGYGDFKGKRYIRMICVNPEVTEQDIDRFLENVLMVADAL